MSAQIPPGFNRLQIATGLNPTSMVMVPDGRIWIVEKNGIIRIVENQILLDEPLLSIEVDDSNERGLGHIVLHPQFEQNGFFYLFYAVPGMKHNRVSRFTANGNKAIPGSEQIILELDELGADIHNGGAMIFGQDGYLYIATGDGAQNWRGEDLGNTNGKILRVTDLGEAVQDNPWYALNHQRSPLVYAYGLRNPFTMAQHPVTGVMYANDVGGALFEEVNRIEKGAFYGWPRLEGKASGQQLPAEYQDPLYQYAHTNGYCCIVGSTFYLPDVIRFPQEYVGKYFFSDYCKGHIRMLDVSTGMITGTFISDGDRIVDMLVSGDGDFYYLERQGLGDGSFEDNTGTSNGVLWKVTYTGSGAPFISVQPQTTLVSTGEEAHFNVEASGNAILHYTWFLNGQEITGATESKLVIPDVTEALDSSLIHSIVFNDEGIAYTDTVLLRVTANQRPQPEIVNPQPGGLYSANDLLHFEGVAVDPEDGMLASGDLSWKIDFHHGTHAHPAMSWTSGISSGEWQIPSIGEISTDVFYRIYLRATDAEGLSKTIHTDLYPRTGRVEVSSHPQGLVIELDGAPQTAPFEVESVQGIKRYISAPLKQENNDSVWFFKHWENQSDTPAREISTSVSDQFFTAHFEGIKTGKGTGLTGYYYDNNNLLGDPVFTRLDSVINFRFFSNAPDPLLDDDMFSIRWKGYLQPYSSGVYHFAAYVDDGVYFSVDGEVILDHWLPGSNHVRGSKYLDAGRIYPVELRMFEDAWASQMILRWSSANFAEELVPASQLYPDNYLTQPAASGLLNIQSINDQQLIARFESYKDVAMEFSITNTSGQVVLEEKRFIDLGPHLLSFDLWSFAPGVYFLYAVDGITGESVYTKFVKVR